MPFSGDSRAAVPMTTGAPSAEAVAVRPELVEGRREARGAGRRPPTGFGGGRGVAPRGAPPPPRSAGGAWRVVGAAGGGGGGGGPPPRRSAKRVSQPWK